MNIEKLVPYNKRMETNFRRLLRGRLYIKRNLDPIKYEKEIDWNFNHHRNPRTYQVYLHSLNFVNDITWSHIKSPKTMKVKLARAIIDDWIKYHLEESDILKENNLAWNEHAVSYRIINLIFFQSAYKNTSKFEEEEFQNLLLKHADFLFEDENYKENNHGIMMDNALLCTSFFINDTKKKKMYQEKSISRLYKTINRDFSEKGVHLENSPEYHKLVRILFQRTEYLLDSIDIIIPTPLKDKLEKTYNYNQLILKPDSYYPLIGDTGQIKEQTTKKIYKNFVDTEAGQCIIQYKDKLDNLNSKHLVFLSGYSKLTHKHYDDLSFVYFENGNDIFIDSGKYSYNKNNEVRKYIISPSAHNTLLIKDMEYKYSDYENDKENLGIKEYKETEDYTKVRGINNLYKDTNISRTLINTKEGIIFIVDEIDSQNKQLYYQNFNLAPDAKVKYKDKKSITIEAGDMKYILETVKVNNVKISTEITTGKISEKFGNYKPNPKAAFIKKGKSSKFLTYFHNGMDDVSIVSYSFKDRSIVYEYNSQIKSLEF